MKIGIFGPSSACSSERYVKSKNLAKSIGFDLEEGHDPSAFYGKDDFLFSCDSIEKREEAFFSLLKNPSIDLVHAVRGGYGAVEMLPKLDVFKKNLLKNPLKREVFFSGISDVTTLLLSLYGVSNLRLIHGPGFIDAFNDYNSDKDRKTSTDSLIQIINGNWKGYYNLKLQNISKSQKEVTGEVLGGNLAVVVSLLGTPYLPDMKGKILFLEETGEKPYRVHRALSQLKLAGIFDKLAAVLIGDFINCNHLQGLGPSIDRVFQEFFTNIDIPVFKGFPGGHSALNLPIPLGINVNISENSLSPNY